MQFHAKMRTKLAQQVHLGARSFGARKCLRKIVFALVLALHLQENRGLVKSVKDYMCSNGPITLNSQLAYSWTVFA